MKEDGCKIVPITCSCCTKCWLFIEGPRANSCVHGGPYKGYVEVKEKDSSHYV